MKTILLTFAYGIIGISLFAQTNFTTSDATISFFSDAPIEDIKAVSNHGRGGIDFESNRILFVVPIKTFVFAKSLMQKHFNENYMESDLYPNAKFDGHFTKPVDTLLTSPQTVNFSGDMTIHGVSRKISEDVTLTYHPENITANSSFTVKTKDYGIKIPRILIKNIAEEILIEIEANLKPATP